MEERKTSIIELEEIAAGIPNAQGDIALKSFVRIAGAIYRVALEYATLLGEEIDPLDKVKQQYLERLASGELKTVIDGEFDDIVAKFDEDAV